MKDTFQTNKYTLLNRSCTLLRKTFNFFTGGPEISILLVRHGESEGNVNAENYTKIGDSDTSVTPLGWTQSYHNGQFLGGLYPRRKIKKWPVLYLSGHLRTMQTFTGMYETLKDVFSDKARLFEDPRLIEQFYGALSAMHFPKEKWHKDTIETLLDMSRQTVQNDPFSTSNLFGESPKSIQGDVKQLIDGTLRRDIDEGKTNFLIVTHGAVIQAFIRSWAHVPYRQKKIIENPNNCDVIEIRGRAGRWTITKIYDGKKMEPVNINVLANVKYPTVDDLPPVPDHIKALKANAPR